MPTAAAIAKINGFLDTQNAEEAAQLVIGCLSEITEEQQTIYRVLDGLYKDENDTVLTQLIDCLQGEGLLRRETLIFTMRVAFRAKEYQKALDAINELLTISDNEIEALRTGGRIGNVLNDDAIALQYWERLANALAADTEAPLQAARLRLRKGDFAEALGWAIRASELRPTAEEPLLLAVGAAIEAGWSEQCDGLLARLLLIEKERALAMLKRLQSRESSETVARVLSILLHQTADDDDLADIAGAAYQGWLAAGLEYELDCRDLEAAAYYRAARKLRPQQSDGQLGIERLRRYCVIGMREAFQTADFDTILQSGELATRIDPDCFEAWQMTGRAHLHRSDLANAAAAFRRCIELMPEDVGSWLDYGRVLNQSGDRPGALGAFQKIQQCASSEHDREIRREADATITALYPALIQDARNAAAAGDIDLCRRYCQAAAEIDPNGTELEQVRRTLLRDLRQEIRQLWTSQSSDVVTRCRQFLELSPEDSFVLTVLGRMLMRSRAYADALWVWEKLVSLDPAEGHFHLQVARCCRSLNLKTKGLAAANTALEQDGLQEAAELINILNRLPTPA